MTTGPDLTVRLEDFEYTEEEQAFIETLPFRFPSCCGAYNG